jgi:hypothetical protein
MTEKRNRVFLGQLTKRTGSYGDFWSGRIGMAQMIVSPSKDPAKVNVYLEETQQPADKPAMKQGGFEDRMADDGRNGKDLDLEIPF